MQIHFAAVLHPTADYLINNKIVYFRNVLCEQCMYTYISLIFFSSSMFPGNVLRQLFMGKLLVDYHPFLDNSRGRTHWRGKLEELGGRPRSSRLANHEQLTELLDWTAEDKWVVRNNDRLETVRRLVLAAVHAQKTKINKLLVSQVFMLILAKQGLR